ncbi:hypothetical protein [Bradyrhizobium elkanii]|uniref:hypothetical protein n=1 Tax=Bradyrhizobium elkanii TaxID=29448 RepID=UPI001449C273|nr:hypothetical protein [Bradyrhizobium elkanii]MCS3577655.1 hypothetical protein [Bradyrhizobium elkanii]MCS3720530.1 hypothetical protein [Bradyrhizobium elkanii]MCS4004947.1 hypothetical protein [Bradyrhizobium elkanii USDA 61]BBC00104.1 hypothetical protein BE61_55580 [Bradyrhizobium elkanii USDA 61]
MAEKDLEQLRIRLGGRLLRRIDIAREKSGRTRNDEIEVRLLESFMKNDLEMVAEMAVHNVLLRVERLEKARAEAAGQTPTDFYKALVDQARKEVEDSK